MNAFLNTLKEANFNPTLRKNTLTTLQVNTGDLCNQSCRHCHVGASPTGKKVMSRAVIKDILNFLSQNQVKTLDITGGAPELNPHFDFFLSSARPLVEEIIVRSNLTVFFEPGKEYLPYFFQKHRVHLISSLPCYLKENVDSQRGEGVFEKSIKALRLLNKLGFATNGLSLDLVHNPLGANLPPAEASLEADYRRILKKEYNISFNRLIVITNVPIKRFKDSLESQAKYTEYCILLKENFNAEVLENIMCRTLLSVGPKGEVYDCDFNQALNLPQCDKEGKNLCLRELQVEDLKNQEIILGEHCFACTAGAGSSCQGTLVGAEQEEILPQETASQVISSRESVQDYYGRVLRGSKDLKTNACCSEAALPKEHREILNNIAPEIIAKFYGCGYPLPPLLQGRRILDLGCGTGRDAYLASYLTGEQGFVLGVDMTEEQLQIAEKYLPEQMERFEFSRANIGFLKGYIEDLAKLGIKSNSQDVVISNCVINLSPDKEKVFREIFRVLKPGGELYFSDVFTNRRVPGHLKDDPVLYGECLSGALYLEDFRRMMRRIGCPDYRVITRKKISLKSAELGAKVGMIDFYSLTIRAFKLASLEDTCEDYGQVAKYLGSIAEHPLNFPLDENHLFIAKKPLLVCGNTASMLEETRYREHFEVLGDKKIHYGLFDCAPASDKLKSESLSLGGSCC